MRRKDINKILIIGSGPIIIGQAAEFDYSGTQACKALKEDGFSIILVNSNPATIMTDPQFSDRTYIEPITAEFIEKIIEIERPNALLPTLGGQTALNVTCELAESGVLERFGVEMIGASYEAIKKAENRRLFKQAIENIHLDLPRSAFAYTIDEARIARETVGLPCVIRPSFTLAGTGGGIAYNVDEFDRIAQHGLAMSPISEILVEESIVGWKEFELEMMRDKKDNVVVVCTIENLDPMGVHTGDSITVAPIQTLTDKEYQRMRDAAIAIIREIGVDTGGANIQFAVNPDDGRMVVIEMNPRVSRSSSLASKATGFPIAKIAAKLAVGYTLDEILNEITKKTPACFEPTLDYCVVKIPRFNFEKFPEADPVLTTKMKSVGEVMAIGRTFKEAYQKAVRSLEEQRLGFRPDNRDLKDRSLEELRELLATPGSQRLHYLYAAFKKGMHVREAQMLTRIDRWFLNNIYEIAQMERRLETLGAIDKLDEDTLREAKRFGFSDVQLAAMFGTTEQDIRVRRKKFGVIPTYKLVDTCAAEFESYTPYYYSCYETEDESKSTRKKKVMILGSGPNRIGQGIEFDYCCVQASLALREMGFETIMVNSNPETVSTDYDISDQLFFEPLTSEDVHNICERISPEGIIVQFGGQTPLNICRKLQQSGFKVVGTSPEQIDRAEDRKKFQEVVRKLKIVQPPNGTATNYEEALEIAMQIGFPVLVRPSYVLGGRAMEIVYGEQELATYMEQAVLASPEFPVLIDKFLEDAIEVDVDAISDGEIVVVAGVMEHIEEAGIHSGDSACALPPYTLSDYLVKRIKHFTYALANELQVRGLMNIQFAVKNDIIYILEVNPRASRTVPFVSKATGMPLAFLAAKVMMGAKLRELGYTEESEPAHIAVKRPVFPFNRFPGVDILLGPEMKSTGEVMGIDDDFGCAFAKAQIGALQSLPMKGKVFISVKDMDKRAIISIAKRLVDMGFEIVSTAGTRKVLKRSGIDVEMIKKIREGRPNVLDIIKNGSVTLVINTSSGKKPRGDDTAIRALTVVQNIPCITTLSGAAAAVNGIESMRKGNFQVKALQDYHSVTQELLF